MIDLDAAARKVQAECLCTRARVAARLLSRIYDEALRPVDLGISQLPILVGTARFGDAGAPIGRLANALGMDRTTVTRNLGPLEKRGLVRVARSPDDARLKVVLLTRKGEQALASGMPLWEEVQQAVLARLGAARSGRLGAELDAVRAVLDEE